VFSSEEKQALKFVQFVAVRTDFPTTQDQVDDGAVISRNTIQRQQDTRTMMRRKGMINSIAFAHRLNPLSNKD